MHSRFGIPTALRAGTTTEVGPHPPIPVAAPRPLGVGGRPAARLGDETAHGGTIRTASADVVVGGKPAARVADMHVCSETGVMGPIQPPGSATVFVNFRSAARLGDQCSCGSAPDVITGAEYTVLIG